jgi:hypothetical protein
MEKFVANSKIKLDIPTISVPNGFKESFDETLKSPITGKIQRFDDLSMGWKTMVVIGAISIIVVVGLAILLILIFETDIIPIEMILGSKEDLDLSEYDDFFNSMDKELEAELGEDFENSDLDSDLDSIFDDSSSLSTTTRRTDLIRKIDEISMTLDRMTEIKESHDLDENIIDWSLLKIDLVPK